MDNSSFSYSSPRTKRSFSLSRFSNYLKKKNLIKVILPLIVILVVVISVKSLFDSNNKNVAGISASSKSTLEVKLPIEKTTINRTFEFPLKDEKGREIGKFTYTLETAEITDEIILKGSRANAVRGRQFLIVNLKLVNALNQGIQINSRDYIRLSVNGNNREFLAPDIHNDPVEVQAISTKYTRVGFPINETDKNPILHIGEINGAKATINLKMKK